MAARKNGLSRRSPANRDPKTVQDVRRIRAQMLKEAGGDIKKLMDIARREVDSRKTDPRPKKRSRKAA